MSKCLLVLLCAAAVWAGGVQYHFYPVEKHTQYLHPAHAVQAIEQPVYQHYEHYQPQYHQAQYHQPQYHQPQYHQPQYHQPQYHQVNRQDNLYQPHHQIYHHQNEYPYPPAGNPSRQASVVLQGKISGELSLVDNGVETTISGYVAGLSPGLHGFHVHEKGDLANMCQAAGGHFNPDNKSHGAPTVAERHAGDLGNIEADASGVAQVYIVDRLVRLDGGRYDVSNRAVVVHADPDDLGRGGYNDSLTTGHAGARLGCGLITLVH